MTSTPTAVQSLTLGLGTVISIPDLWEKSIIRIEQKQYDNFQITFNETDASATAAENVIDVDTRGYDRLRGREPDYATGTLLENADFLDLTINDVLSLPTLGQMQIGRIVRIRPDRYQVRLDVKFVASVFMDILVKS